MTKFHDKFESLRQVNSPNSQDKFQICCTCTKMYLVRFLVNVVVFCVFLRMSQDFVDVLKEIRGSETE